jgi:site-specific recombinase XerD
MNKLKDGKAPLYAKVSVDSIKREISLKRTIEPESWNGGKGLAKGTKTEVKELNFYLEQVKSKLMDCYKELQLSNKLITADAIKNAFLGEDEKGHSLLTLIEYHNTELSHTLEWGTLKNYMTTQKYVKQFLKEKMKTSDLFLSQLNYKFLTDFEYFLLKNQPKDHHKPCGNNTVMKHIERLRKMINIALKNEWIEKDPFAKFKKTFTKTTRECLTEQELENIENKVFRIERLDFIRDLFVFSCYTGLAYIDVMQLTPNSIVKGIDGEMWLYTNRQKTDTNVKVPLLPQALHIIEKYKNHPKAENSGTLFPVISNQKLNSYLKEIADVCAIEKNLTFHLARHTFATTITLTNGVPIETVSKLLGHNSIRTTQIYAKVVERKVSEDMQVLRNKIGAKSESTTLRNLKCG